MVAIKRELSEVLRYQTHLRVKQDQIVTKQDQIQSTLVGETTVHQ